MPTAISFPALTAGLVAHRVSRMTGRETVCIDEAGWTELKTTVPGVTLGLGDTDKASPGNCVPVFYVSDINAARSALEKQSVEFDGDTITMEGMVSIATFHDPDGNAIMLAEDLTGSNQVL